MPNAYIAYCDESGQRSYGPGTDKHFIVAAVLVPSDDAVSLGTELAGLKRAHWGDPGIELKSHWIRRPTERRKHYTEPHGIRLGDIQLLVKALYRWLRKSPVKLLAGVVDKPMMQKRYSSPHYAGAVSYTMFLQRYEKYLAKRHATGRIVFDDPAGKSPGGEQWKTLLKRQHTRLRKYGCPYTNSKFQRVQGLDFVDSSAEVFVQVADIVSYNTFRQFRDHGADWEDDSLRTLPLYEHFAEVASLFDRGPKGEFSGFGVAKWPISKRVDWIFKGSEDV